MSPTQVTVTLEVKAAWKTKPVQMEKSRLLPQVGVWTGPLHDDYRAVCVRTDL